jgi:hypothetical protein
MSEIKLRKAPKSVSEKGMKPVVYTLVKTKDGKYPPFYQIPAEDEIYAEWEDESGVARSGLRTIRYAPGEKSIFLDEQSSLSKRGTLMAYDGVIIADPREIIKQKYLNYTNHNIANHEEGTAMSGKSAIFRVNNSEYSRNIKLQKEELKQKLKNIVNDLSSDEIEGLALTLNVAFDGEPSSVANSIASARLTFYEMIDYDPARFEKEIQSETRKYRQVISIALRANILEFDKAGRSFYNNIGGKTRILDVPVYKDPVEFFVEMVNHRSEMKEAYNDIKEAIEGNKKPTEEKFQRSKEFKTIKRAMELGICKSSFGSINAANLGRLGVKGSGIKGATQHLEHNPHVLKDIEEMIKAADLDKSKDLEKTEKPKK